MARSTIFSTAAWVSASPHGVPDSIRTGISSASRTMGSPLDSALFQVASCFSRRFTSIPNAISKLFPTMNSPSSISTTRASTSSTGSTGPTAV
ncbi:unnamed protein product [Phytophthora fragariaefolia]|uniref:Unnamed protein product n=1 Tax=Phytophthora fragariaefolia TaxID=1490495 RepID=A0A9W7CTN3_9STRA|nr:unnamed protein product [Phytophthora fragariaefolia]